MKKIFILLLFIFFPLLSHAQKIENNFMPKDSFIPVYPIRPISTSIVDENETVYFIVPSDLWIEEFKIIPKDSVVKGKIAMLKMPVTGINAALKIDADLIVFPDGTKHKLSGFITTNGDRQIGGNLTPPLSYNKTFHPRKGEYFSAYVAQYVPSGEYEFGQHITLLQTRMLQLVLLEDFSPY